MTMSLRSILLVPALALAIAVAACSNKSIFEGGTSFTASIQNPVKREHQAAIEASYNVAASAVLAYSRRPRCAAGQNTSLTNLCSQWTVVQKLMAANRFAYAALVKSRKFVDQNDQFNAIKAFNEAVAALREFKAIAVANGIRV